MSTQMARRTTCVSCLSLIHDMIAIPSVPNEYFHSLINRKRLTPHVYKISKLFYNILERINVLDQYMIERFVKMCKPENVDECCIISKEEANWWAMFKYISCYKAREEISILQEFLDSHTICEERTGKLWIGYWISNLWHLFTTIHVEHLTKKPSVTGPPIGMKVYSPSLPPNPHISSCGADSQKIVDVDELYL